MTRAWIPLHHICRHPQQHHKHNGKVESTSMSRDDDDDLQLHRAALSFRDNLKLLLPKLLRTRKHDLVPAHLIGAVCTLV